MPDQPPLQQLLDELRDAVARRQVVVTAAQQWSAGRLVDSDLLKVVGEYEKGQVSNDE